MAEYSAEGTGFAEPGQGSGGTTDPYPPLRLYRFADAPPSLRALSDAGGGEVLLAVVPAAWLEEAVLNGLPHVLWLLLAADTVLDWPTIEGTWGAMQRAAQPDGSRVVIVSRP